MSDAAEWQADHAEALEDAKTTAPETYPCSGCAFSYTLVKANRKSTVATVIRKHNSRTGPGLCPGAKQLPKETEHIFEDSTDVAWVHPGPKAECSAPECCSHPNGFGVNGCPCGATAPAEDVPACCDGCEGTEDDAAAEEADALYAVSRDREDTEHSGDPGIQPAAVDTGDGVSGVDGSAGRTRLRTDERGGPPGESAQADVPPVGGGDPRGLVDRSPVPEPDLRGPGSPGGGDVVRELAQGAGGGGAPELPENALLGGSPVRREQHAVCVQRNGEGVPNLPGSVQQGVPGQATDPWMSPGPASDIPEQSVSMQPDPDRDRWGRYMLPIGTGKAQPHTRVTTFVKAASSTFALEQWAARMVIKGLVLRPDLLALAHGLDVKRDKGQLDSIAAQAKEAAGQKVAANLGSAYHAFTERLDAGLITLADVPEMYRERVGQYADKVRHAGLTTRVEWIERTTAVRADQVSAALPVAGTLDRIFQLPNGELIIGDLKTGSDLTYGWKEIESQLAVYAHGVNTFGLFDWNTKTWQNWESNHDEPRLRVRTDYGLVVHLPADGNGCKLYRVDLERGWRRAQVCGQVMADQKVKASGMEIIVPGLPEAQPVHAQPRTGPQERRGMAMARAMFQVAASRDALLTLAEFAGSSGEFTPGEMQELEAVARVRWEELTV